MFWGLWFRLFKALFDVTSGCFIRLSGIVFFFDGEGFFPEVHGSVHGSVQRILFTEDYVLKF